MKTITDLSFEDFKTASRQLLGDDYCLTPRKLYRNFRDGRGFNLSYIGVLILKHMGFYGYDYRFNSTKLKITPHIRTLFDRYFDCPYYLDNNQFIIYDTESIALFKLYGSDWESWIEHMEHTIQSKETS